MANKIFRQVFCSERLPEKEGCYLTNASANNFFYLKDSIYYHANMWWDVVWWLEEVELPSEVEKPLLEYVINKHTQEECIGFIDGFTKAIELIKGEGLNNPTTN